MNDYTALRQIMKLKSGVDIPTSEQWVFCVKFVEKICLIELSFLCHATSSKCGSKLKWSFLAYRIGESLVCQCIENLFLHIGYGNPWIYQCMENLIFHLITLNSSSVYQHNTQARSSDCHLSAWTTSGLAT